ncbi:MAG: hypothetical protein RJB38_1797 [Pseudomonadota bacterium]
MIQKLASLLTSILIVFIASRALIRALPGDPLDSLLAETAVSIPREAIAQDLGLDLPFWKSCSRDLKRLLHGDLGYSLMTREPVFPTMTRRLASSLQLTFGALFLALAIAIPSALVAANPRGSRFFKILAQGLSGLSISIPLAWLGPILLYVFTIVFPWGEMRGSFSLACIALALPLAGNWFRVIELRISQEARQDYYRSALARGLSVRRALLKHALAPAAGSLLATLGSQFGSLLAGSFIIEWVFDLPGMGLTWVQATLQRDYPMMEAATLFGAITCLLGVSLGDVLQRQWDPRQREIS